MSVYVIRIDDVVGGMVLCVHCGTDDGPIQ